MKNLNRILFFIASFIILSCNEMIVQKKKEKDLNAESKKNIEIIKNENINTIKSLINGSWTGSLNKNDQNENQVYTYKIKFSDNNINIYHKFESYYKDNIIPNKPRVEEHIANSTFDRIYNTYFDNSGESIYKLKTKNIQYANDNSKYTAVYLIPDEFDVYFLNGQISHLSFKSVYGEFKLTK